MFVSVYPSLQPGNDLMPHLTGAVRVHIYPLLSYEPSLMSSTVAMERTLVCHLLTLSQFTT